MNDEIRIKWLMYTVCIGLLPISLRLLLIRLGLNIPYFSINDFIAFGFVLHISILNEIEHVIEQKVWKTMQNGISIVAIFVYGAFSCALMLRESGNTEFDLDAFKSTAMIAAVVSFVISLSVFYRPNKIAGVIPCS
ncbi:MULTISPECIES: hypothetical protein [Shewanella]|uniref:hypothetical protein n=1 Tax=Shewanella TaxID=22 RepID=UPI00059DE355|nr:hypothetical protein [Shewanella sp. ANA-3]